MFGLVFSALRARRSQTLALFGLTVLAAMGASAAPWFLGWARDQVATADATTAPAIQRVVIAAGAARYNPSAPSPIGLLRERIDRELVIPGAQATVGARLYVAMRPAGAAVNAPTAGLYLNYRDDVCAQLHIDGACPTGPGQVLVGTATAASLGLHTGDQVTFEGFRLTAPVTLTISGTYEVASQLSTYWVGTDLLSGPVGAVNTVVDEPTFVSEETLLATNPNGLDLDLHLYLPIDAYHGTGLGGTLELAASRLRLANLDLRSEAPNLIAQITREQRLVTLGVTVAATQLVALCWFVLFLAVRHSSDERRPDIGLLKLRGAAEWRIWMLTGQQSAIPMLAGALLGWGLGYLAAAVLAGNLGAVSHTLDTDPASTLRWSMLAAAAASLGALLAAVLAEWRALRSSVAGLLRRVPVRRRGWRTEIGDLALVAVAVAGVYQGYVDLRSGGEPSVLALLAPGLVGLGAALFVARALPFLAGKVGAAALRTGRPGATLTALHLARRPGTHRVFAVLAVSVSVFTTAIFFWHTANLAWGDRAAQELGAQRVLTVQAPNSTMLLAAVRAADPSGEHAMAVARGTGVRVESRILAVDSTRFAAVAEIPTGGGTATDIARLLRPAAQSAPVVQAGALTLDAAGPPQPETDRPVRLRVHLAAGDGTETTVDFGPLTAARATYQATVTGCPGGCRLVSFEPVLNLQDAIPAATQVSLYSLAQSGREVVSGAMFSDITRWRTQVGSVGLGEVVSARDGRLALAPFIRPLPQSQRRDLRVFSVDTPVPLPVVLAGARPVPVRAGDERITVLGTERVAFQVVGRAAVLPRLGDIGGVVDLEYAQRMVTNGTENAVLEVWLTADAPAEVLDRLRGAGVRILTEDSMPVTADRYAQQGPGLALEFELFAAGIVLLLAAGTIVVTATVERRSRVEELMAMRVQGLSERAMRVAGHGGTGVLVASAVLTGLSAAVAGQAMVAASMPIFADGWALLPMRLGPRPTSLTVAFLGAATVLGVAATLGSARVVAAVTARRTGQQP